MKQNKQLSQITADKVNWPEYLPRVIAFDIDGTLSDNAKLWKKLKDRPVRGSAKFGSPKRDVIRGMRFVKKLGYEIAIYTARAKSEEKELVKWLKRHKIPYDYLWIDQKPPFIILVDDRVVDVQRKSWFGDLKRKLRAMCYKKEEIKGVSRKDADKLTQRFCRKNNKYAVNFDVEFDEDADLMMDCLIKGILSNPNASKADKDYWREMNKVHEWKKK